MTTFAALMDKAEQGSHGWTEHFFHEMKQWNPSKLSRESVQYIKIYAPGRLSASENQELLALLANR